MVTYDTHSFLCLIVINKICHISQKLSDFANSTNTRSKFRKLQPAIWLTVIKEIFKFSPPLESFGQENYLYELSLGYPNYPTQK